MSRRCRFSTVAAHLLAMATAGAITGGGALAQTAADVEPGAANGLEETGADPDAVAEPGADPALPAEPGAAAVRKSDLGVVVAQRMEFNDAVAESQVRIDEISAQADATIAVYRNTNQRIDALRTYNHQLEELILAQDEEVAALRGEIDGIELIAREVTPMMLKMVEALDNFVELDVPFLAEERSVRVAELRKVMARADVTEAERYRRIVEAYRIEEEYGRTIEAYQGELEVNGETRRVEFLRVGRIALLYQTLDGAETGVWDHQNQEWQEAASSRSAVRKGIRVARKQTAPDMLRIPVPAAGALQ